MNTLLHILSAPVHSPGGHGGGHNAPWVLWVLGPVFIVIGLVGAVKPDAAWRLSRWQYKNKDALEPSNAALIVQRIGGAFFVVVGIVLLVIAATR